MVKPKFLETIFESLRVLIIQVFCFRQMSTCREEENTSSAVGDVEDSLGAGDEANNQESEGEQSTGSSSSSAESSIETALEGNGSSQEAVLDNLDSVADHTESFVDIPLVFEEAISDNLDSVSEMQDINTGSVMETVSDDSDHSYFSDSDTEVSHNEFEGTEVKMQMEGTAFLMTHHYM